MKSLKKYWILLLPLVIPGILYVLGVMSGQTAVYLAGTMDFFLIFYLGWRDEQAA